MMDEGRFWEIIEASRQAALRRERAPLRDLMDDHEQTLADELRQLSAEEVAAFDERFWECHHRAYRWDLWAAAYWLHGGCGNDGFTDFRACLISLGKERFYQVLEDPDALADIVERPDAPYMQCEGIQYIASRVYEEKSGGDMPWRERTSHGRTEPAGERIDEEDRDAMRRRFPKIVARFPDMGG